MAVEAHLNLIPSHLTQDREIVNPCYNGQQMRLPAGIPLGTTLPAVNYSFYPPAVCDSVQAKTSVHTESGLTYNIPVDSRKRSRDSMNLYATQNFSPLQKNNNFVGEDILQQIQQHHLEIDAIISQHNKKIRLELEQRQNEQTRLLTTAIGETVMKKLKEKDEQIQQIRKLNYVLQERAKSIFFENQLWRNLAQSNEATANSLRTNLEQVIAQVGGGGEERISTGTAAQAVEEDAESCCGSNDDVEAQDKEDKGRSCYREQRCTRCGERESCVLLLPCRHLCLCNVCGSGSHQLQTCPVCNFAMNATLHVNMSS